MNDSDLQEEVITALEWEPGIDAARIDVRLVRAVANDIDVVPDGATDRSDPAIAGAVANALELDSALSDVEVMATVTNGWVTLTGGADAEYQRSAAERAVRELNPSHLHEWDSSAP